MLYIRTSIETRAIHLSGRSISSAIQVHLCSQQRTQSRMCAMNLVMGHGALPLSPLCCIAFEVQLFERGVEDHSPASQ